MSTVSSESKIYFKKIQDSVKGANVSIPVTRLVPIGVLKG